MADIRTLKDGRLYLLKDGSSANSFAATAGVSGGWFKRSDGTWSAMVQESSGFVTYTGGTTLCAIKSGTGALETAGTVAKPVFYEQGSTIHHWFANDEGAGTFDLRYEVSTNGGASFSSRVDLNILGDQAWCNDAAWPLYFDFERDGADNHRLWVIGRNGTVYTVGYVAINTVGTFATEIADPANYTLQASASSSHDFDSEHVAMTKYRGRYYLYHTGSAVGGVVRVSSSDDGVGWTRFEECAALSIGLSGTNDDSYLWPASAGVNQGAMHLMYIGNDGANSRPMLAVGESPERLTKVPWMDPSTFGASDLLVSYAAELTFDMADLHTHHSDRGKPGGLSDAPFAPQPISFTARLTGEMGDASGAFSWLADSSLSPQAGEDQFKSNALELGRLNVAYITEDSAGDPAEFYLFPDVAFSAVSVSEGADGITINASGLMHSMRRPLFGGI